MINEIASKDIAVVSLRQIRKFGHLLAKTVGAISVPATLGICLLATGGVAGHIAQAQEADATPKKEAPASEKLDARSEAIWQRYWKKAASSYIKLNGEYICTRWFNDRVPSSRGVTVNGLMSSDKGVVLHLRTDRGASFDQRVMLTLAEAQAVAMALPSIEVGSYGYINSVEIERILSPTEMVVRSIWLVDSQATNKSRDDDRARLIAQYGYYAGDQIVEALYQNRYKLVQTQDTPIFRRSLVLSGYSTEKLAGGMRWSGPDGNGLHVAIVNVRDVGGSYGNNHGSQRILIAVPVSLLRAGLNSDEFAGLLASRQMTRQDLLGVISDASREVMKDVEKSMIDAIEAKGPQEQTANEDKPAQDNP